MEISKELRKKYNSNFIKRHKDDKFHCEYCNKDYSIFNKYHHENTLRHLINTLNDKPENIEKVKKHSERT